MYPFTLPSGLTCELRELTGAEEELLTNPRLMRSGDGLTQVMRACLVRLGEKDDPTPTNVLDLLAGDRLFILVKLRQISLGDEVALSLTCPNPNCRATTRVVVNLADLPVTPYPETREGTCTLPGSGTVVTFVPLDGHKEKRLAALSEASLAQAMLMRISAVDGQPPTKRTLADLPLRDVQALRQAMLAADGGLDTTVETTCGDCGAPIRARVESSPDFLFPAAG
jgi:hypothetical protein